MKKTLALLSLLLLSSAAPGQDAKTWTHGPPSDPNYFPLAVWLQDTRNIAKY